MTAMALLAFMCVLWGGNIVSIKVSVGGIPPIRAVALRDAVASFCIFLYARVTGEKLFFERADVKHGLALGVIFGINFLLLYWGAVYTDASRAVIFLYTQPFWISLGAHFLLRTERLSISKSLGLSIAFIGLVMVFSSAPSGSGHQHWLGDLMEVGAALFWAASILYIKKFASHRSVSPVQTLFVQLFFSIPLLLIATLIFEWGRPIVVTRSLVAHFIYQSVVVAFCTYMVYLWMVHRYPVGRLAVFSFLTPLMGMLFSAVLLGEALNGTLVAGFASVLAGIYLVNRSTQAQHVPESSA
jgi:drug/metabolite transporter (DMT)-like permease